MLSLSTEEIKKVSALLLSENPESILLGYELVKQNQDCVDALQKELLLLAMLHNDQIIAKRVRAFLMRRYKTSGQFDEWKKGFQIFSRIQNAYSMTEKLQASIIAHEVIRKDYQSLIEKNKHYAKQYFELARVLHYYIETHFELCEVYYKIAINGNPSDYSAWFNLGHLQQNHLYNNKESVHCYEEVLKINPKMAAAYNNIGVILESEKQDYEKAYAHFKKAFDLANHSNLYRCNVASLALKLGDVAEFEQMIKLVFASDRHYYRAMNQWANYLWEFKQDYKKAEKEYKKGLTYYPNDTHLLGNLGEMYADIYHRYEEALELYERSLAEKKSIYRLTTVVTLLALQMNQLDKAAIYYKELKELQEKTGKIRDSDLKEKQWTDFLAAEKRLLDYLS